MPAGQFIEIVGPIPRPGQQPEIRYDDDGDIDEVVASGAQVQVERMGHDAFVVIINDRVFNLYADSEIGIVE